MLKHRLALTIALITFLYTIYTIIEAINADGTWYNQLYMNKGRENVTFADKLGYTLTENTRKISPVRITAVTAALPILAYIVTRVLVAGVRNF